MSGALDWVAVGDVAEERTADGLAILGGGAARLAAHAAALGLRTALVAKLAHPLSASVGQTSGSATPGGARTFGGGPGGFGGGGGAGGGIYLVVGSLAGAGLIESNGGGAWGGGRPSWSTYSTRLPTTM